MYRCYADDMFFNDSGMRGHYHFTCYYDKTSHIDIYVLLTDHVKVQNLPFDSKSPENFSRDTFPDLLNLSVWAWFRLFHLLFSFIWNRNSCQFDVDGCDCKLLSLFFYLHMHMLLDFLNAYSTAHPICLTLNEWRINKWYLFKEWRANYDALLDSKFANSARAVTNRYAR